MASSIFLACLNGYEPEWADAWASGVADVFPYPVRPMRLELDLQPAYAPERRQYHATMILAGLFRHLPRHGKKILGITTVDLFIPVLTFVFGQSQLDGPAAVVSTHRLESTFYGLPPDEGLLLERTIKESVHELGHAFGLVHCPEQECVMHASTYVEEVDIRGAEFCEDCRGRLCPGRATHD